MEPLLLVLLKPPLLPPALLLIVEPELKERLGVLFPELKLEEFPGLNRLLNKPELFLVAIFE